MRNPRVPAGTLRQATLADAMENHLEPRVEAPLIHLIHTAPGMRRGTNLEVSTLRIGPPLNPAARTKIILGSAHIVKIVTS